MGRSIYKYISSEHIGKVFCSSDVATLKCSLPKEFNDPYELFLTIDFNERPDALAYYVDAIGELPQLPTTCFSRSPSVLPMWAHYAQNLEGFAIEFDEDALANFFIEGRFGDVEYLESPKTDIAEMLYRAYVIGKPRHTYFLQSGVFRAAYFRKASCWSYEQERRMVLLDGEKTRHIGALTLIDVPSTCVTAIICGSRASLETAQALKTQAEALKFRYFDLRVGRSSATPFFVGLDGQTFSFDGKCIIPDLQHCKGCNEPVTSGSSLCSWCQINDMHRTQAAARNPQRLLAHYGMLDSYIEQMDAIGEKFRKK